MSCEIRSVGDDDLPSETPPIAYRPDREAEADARQSCCSRSVPVSCSRFTLNLRERGRSQRIRSRPNYTFGNDSRLSSIAVDLQSREPAAGLSATSSKCEYLTRCWSRLISPANVSSTTIGMRSLCAKECRRQPRTIAHCKSHFTSAHSRVRRPLRPFV